MFQRTITAIIGIAIFVPICIFSATPLFTAAVIACAFIAIYEMSSCIGMKKHLSLTIPVYIVVVISPICVRLVGDASKFIVIYSAMMFLLLIYFFAVSVFTKGKYRIEQASTLYVTSMYIITSFCSIMLLRDMPNGKFIYILAIAGPWVSDIFAYLWGRALGKHKLIPHVSPKKTVEGAVGGIIFCGLSFMLYGLIVSVFFNIKPEYPALLIAGFLVSVIAQVGDLIASLIKRQYDLKDYGNLFPGHGGIMDRFDSVISTAPFLLIICSIPNVFTLFF